MSSNQSFKVEEKVFANKENCPPWPGIIYGIKSDGSTQPIFNVYLYGTGEHIECFSKDLFSYEKYKSKLGKSNKNKYFDEALKQIKHATKLPVFGKDNNQECSMSNETNIGVANTHKYNTRNKKKLTDESSSSNNQISNQFKKYSNSLSSIGRKRKISPYRLLSNKKFSNKYPVFQDLVLRKPFVLMRRLEDSKMISKKQNNNTADKNIDANETNLRTHEITGSTFESSNVSRSDDIEMACSSKNSNTDNVLPSLRRTKAAKDSYQQKVKDGGKGKYKKVSKITIDALNSAIEACNISIENYNNSKINSNKGNASCFDQKIKKLKYSKQQEVTVKATKEYHDKQVPKKSDKRLKSLDELISAIEFCHLSVNKYDKEMSSNSKNNLNTSNAPCSDHKIKTTKKYKQQKTTDKTKEKCNDNQIFKTANKHTTSLDMLKSTMKFCYVSLGIPNQIINNSKNNSNMENISSSGGKKRFNQKNSTNRAEVKFNNKQISETSDTHSETLAVKSSNKRNIKNNLNMDTVAHSLPKKRKKHVELDECNVKIESETKNISETENKETIAFLETEVKVMGYIQTLQKALQIDHVDYVKALETLRSFSKLPIDTPLLLKHPIVFDTFKKLSMYIGIDEDYKNNPMIEQIQKSAESISLEKMQPLFTVPEGASLDGVFFKALIDHRGKNN